MKMTMVNPAFKGLNRLHTDIEDNSNIIVHIEITLLHLSLNLFHKINAFSIKANV